MVKNKKTFFLSFRNTIQGVTLLNTDMDLAELIQCQTYLFTKIDDVHIHFFFLQFLGSLDNLYQRVRQKTNQNETWNIFWGCLMQYHRFTTSFWNYLYPRISQLQQSQYPLYWSVPDTVSYRNSKWFCQENDLPLQWNLSHVCTYVCWLV